MITRKSEKVGVARLVVSMEFLSMRGIGHGHHFMRESTTWPKAATSVARSLSGTQHRGTRHGTRRRAAKWSYAVTETVARAVSRYVSGEKHLAIFGPSPGFARRQTATAPQALKHKESGK